jgi:rRNA pseudouridine-1189 N-methylase Emg1 (Nep1/Mra1 family)
MSAVNVSKQLERLNTLTVIVLNKRFMFKTMTENVDVEGCGWLCGNFPEGNFNKSIYFAFPSTEVELNNIVESLRKIRICEKVFYADAKDDNSKGVIVY